MFILREKKLLTVIYKKVRNIQIDFLTIKITPDEEEERQTGRETFRNACRGRCSDN